MTEQPTEVTPRTNQRTLRELHGDLRKACADLVDPTVFEDEHDDGTTTLVDGDSLLNQLVDAVASGTGRPGSRGKSTPMPIDAGATDLLHEIDAATLEWNTEPTIEARIRTGVNLAGQFTTAQAVLWVTTRLQRWVTQITDLFNPPRKLHLAAPCPACGKRMVWRTDDTTGETVQVPALGLTQLDSGTFECVCQNPACRHRWPHGNLEHLARVVEQERAEARTRTAGEPLALWQDGSIHRMNTPSSNMALPPQARHPKPEGGSAA